MIRSDTGLGASLDPKRPVESALASPSFVHEAANSNSPPKVPNAALETDDRSGLLADI